MAGLLTLIISLPALLSKMKHNNIIPHKNNNYQEKPVQLYRCQWTKQGTAGSFYLWASSLEEANRIIQPQQYTTVDIRLIEVPGRPIM